MTASPARTATWTPWTVTAPDFVPRSNARTQAEAFLSLSQTQRRLSHLYRKQADESELLGNYRRYADEALEARRLWRSAKFHLRHARQLFAVDNSNEADHG